MRSKRFTVDLNNIDSVSSALKEIQDLLDSIGEGPGRNSGEEDYLQLIFGTMQDGEFREFPPPAWNIEAPSGRPLSLTSEHTFFIAAAGFDIPGRIEETVEKMGESMIMESADAPLGTYAFCGLIRGNTEWISSYKIYLETLCRFEMFADTEETDGISVAVETYGWTEETLELLAARMFGCQGHEGGEDFQTFRDEYALNDALEDDLLYGVFEGALRSQIEEIEDPNLESRFHSCGYDPHGGLPAPGEAGTPCDNLIWELIREYLILDEEDYDYY